MCVLKCVCMSVYVGVCSILSYIVQKLNVLDIFIKEKENKVTKLELILMSIQAIFCVLRNYERCRLPKICPSLLL